MLQIQDVPVTAADGHKLLAFDAGGGPGPAIVLCNSVLGGIDGWHPLIEDFAKYHRVVGWRYRGMTRADRPLSAMQQHTDDLLSVLDHFALDKVVLIGWSMGARVLIDMLRDHAPRVLAGVTICGVMARPLQRLAEPFAGPISALAPAAGDLAAELAPYAPQVWKFIGMGARSRTVHDVLRLIGAVAPTADRPLTEEVLADTAAIPLRHLIATLRAVDRHVVEHEFPDVDTPILLVGGTADPLCPVSDVEHVAGRLLHGQTMIVPSAGHLLPLEFDELLRLRIAKFLRVTLGFDRLAVDRASQSAAPAT